MPRTKTISDRTVFAAVHSLLVERGEKAATFGEVSRAVGLAPPTLVQRYRSQERMVHLAYLDAWDRFDELLAQAEIETGGREGAISGESVQPKEAHLLLKNMGEGQIPKVLLALLSASFRNSELRTRALAWRARCETVLALRFGGGASGQEAASIAFAAWQGQILWSAAIGKTKPAAKGFKLLQFLKRL